MLPRRFSRLPTNCLEVIYANQYSRIKDDLMKFYIEYILQTYGHNSQ